VSLNNLKKDYVVAYDLGTTGNKAALYDYKLNLIYNTNVDYPLYYPEKGFVEQAPKDFWNSMIKTTKEILANSKIEPKNINALICDCQMNSTIPIDKNGDPLMKCISWLDTRAAKTTKTFRKGLVKISGFGIRKLLTFIKITGGAPGTNGKDPISHILWLKKERPEIYDKTFKFLSVKDFILYKCTGAVVTSRDLGNTSWLMNTHPDICDWSEKLLNKLKIDKKKLPKIKTSTEIAGKLSNKAAEQLSLPEKIPVYVGSGDIAAAAIGSGAIMENQIQICLGTADWIGAHTSERKKDLVHYTGSICSAKEDYLCLSKQETGASCLDWWLNIAFKDELTRFKGKTSELYSHLDDLVIESEPGSKGLLFAPWLFGERSPLNDPNVRGGFYNLSLNHERKELLRSLYEGIAFNIKWGLTYIEKLVGKASHIRLMGGGGNSDVWCQILADITNRKIRQVENPSLASARGAAVIALVGLGVLDQFKDAIPLIKTEQNFIPNKETRGMYEQSYEQFLQIYKRNKKMFNALNA
jgi:xylulokinase